MGAYINKAELLKELSVIQDRPVHSAMQIIKILPTIDLVRCGECKHGIKHPIEDVECGLTSIFMSKTDFCSYGERRAE